MFAFSLLYHGLKIGAKSLKRGVRRKRYKGDAKEICLSVLKDCWNGTYFQGSAGHFSQFWARDFGMCSKALIKLGFKNEVRKTLSWALEFYKKTGKITTTIFGKDAIDIWDFSSDSLPLLIFAIRESEAFDILKEHKEFIEREILRYKNEIFDENLGLVKKKRYFSGAKDAMVSSSSTFSNSMVAFLLNLILELDLKNPFNVKPKEIKDNIKKSLWKGDYFANDLEDGIISSDANVWPYWLKVFDPEEEKEMLEKSIKSIQREGLDKPFPLKYTKRRYPEKEIFWTKIFTPNYQGNTIWTQIGPIYISLVKILDEVRAKDYIKQYEGVIEKEGNYLEVFSEDGRPYLGRLGIYRSDEGMIWASLFLDLIY